MNLIIRILKSCLGIALLGLFTQTVFAAPVSVDLSGKAFGPGREIHATSGAAVLPAAGAYNFRLVGTVRGTGLLSTVIPSGTEIGALLDLIVPGSSANLSGVRVNPPGTLPFAVIDRAFSGDLDAPPPFAFSVDASLKLRGQIAASGQVRLDVTNVKFSLASTSINASIVFEPGSRLIVDVAPVVLFSTPSVAVSETAGSVALRVRRIKNLSGAVTVSYVTTGVTADGNDFTPSSGSVTFANGEALKTFTIPILNNTLDDGNRRFRVRLISPTGGAVIGLNRFAFVTIIDDDPAQ